MYTKILIALCTFIAFTAQAHSGRTNAQGCHNDRKNGGYHCHGGSRASPSSSVAASVAQPTHNSNPTAEIPENFYVCTQDIQTLAQTYPAEVLINTQEAYSVKIMHPGVPQTITCLANHTKRIEYTR